MSYPETRSRSHILHLEVSHGADRYNVQLRRDRPPTVRDLMEELEKTTRVTTMNQQLIFRGQRLHERPNAALETFGLFNGNQIMLIGSRLRGPEDDHFRRLLDFEKNVQGIDDLFEIICREFENVKRSQQPRQQSQHFLYDLQGRTDNGRSELQAIESRVYDLNVQPSESDAQRKKDELLALIRDRVDISSNIISAIGSYLGGGQADGQAYRSN